jgi:hypothetical protein
MSKLKSKVEVRQKSMSSPPVSRPHQAQWPAIQSWHLLLLSLVAHLALLLYADHVDSHPERYGGLKYTDVDWRVVSDGAKLIFGETSVPPISQAQGWLIQKLGLPIGE